MKKQLFHISPYFLFCTTFLRKLVTGGPLLIVLCLDMAACGSTGGTAAQPTPTAPPQSRNCGNVQLDPRGIPTNDALAKQAEDCFWQAFQQCHPASFSYSAHGIDTATTRTFTVKVGSGYCSVSDTIQNQIFPQQPGAAKTYSCSGVTQKTDGLHFSGCGQDGDIVVPLPAGH